MPTSVVFVSSVCTLQPYSLVCSAPKPFPLYIIQSIRAEIGDKRTKYSVEINMPARAIQLSIRKWYSVGPNARLQQLSGP
jgi:hypothetical protein